MTLVAKTTYQYPNQSQTQSVDVIYTFVQKVGRCYVLNPCLSLAYSDLHEFKILGIFSRHMLSSQVKDFMVS